MSDDLVEGMIFFFNFLMMTTTLFSFPCGDKERHLFEYFIKTPQGFGKEVLTMNLEKPMIHPIFII